MKRSTVAILLLAGSLGAVACSKSGGGGSGAGAAIAGATSGSTATPSPTTSGTTTPGTTPATGAAITSIITPAGVSQGDVKILYRLADPASGNWDITADFSIDQGKTWQIAREGKGGDGLRALSSAPAPGKEHTFAWDSLADVGPKLASDVRIRITPVGGGAAAATNAFAVDNAPLNTNVQVTRGPYLQNTTKTSTIVVWKTAQPTDSVVEYGETAGLGQTAGNPNAQETTHAVTLTNLKPGTTYYYRIGGSGGPVTTREQFVSAPDVWKKFRFLVFGDSGNGSQEQMDVAKRMEQEKFDLILHTGDVIYPMGAGKDYDPKFFVPYKNMLKRAPIFPAIGNHDLMTLGIAYKDVFYLPANNPSGTEFYYSFEWGDAKFISIETTAFFHVPFGPHMQWLQNELASNTKTWLIVYMHIPLYSSGNHGEDKVLQAILGPLLENYKVSLVLTGHDHHYERTNPIKKYNNDPAFKGLPHLLTGGGGAGLYGVNPKSYTAKAEKAHSYVLCEIDGKNLNGEAKRIDGTTIETFTIQAR